MNTPANGGVPVRRYATVAAFEAALKTRLAASVTEMRTIQDLRKQIAFDRVLVRLSHVAPDAWLLKGGVALEYRLNRARATTDIDVSTRVNFGQMMEILRAAANVSLNDYFALRLGECSKPVDEVATYRFEVAVLLENGRIFERLKIDIGFADLWLGEAQNLTAPALLVFAGIEPATVRAIPIAQHLAEKVHAFTKRYGNHQSTRVKDLVDMVLLVDTAPVDNVVLAKALRDVFKDRATHDVPAALPPPPADWRAAYSRLAADLPIPRTSDEAHRHVAAALAASLEAAASP